MNTELKINVSIAERNFPIKIEAEKEYIYRKAAKLLNDKLLSYRKTYQGLADKDLLGMIAYGYGVQILEKNLDKSIDKSFEELSIVDKELTTIIDDLYK